MALSYAFSPDKGETPETIAQRRQMSNLIAARMLGAAPKNVGEGLNAIGQALIARSMMGDADAAQKAGMASLPDFLKSQITGQPATPSAAPSVSTPMGATSIPAGEIDPRLSSAISTASSSSGVDPAYMTRLALVENGGKVEGGSPLSSAQGPFQFLSGTAKQYGLANPNDPTASADAAARLTLDNKAALMNALGREPTPGELYLAHQQGVGGAIKLLQNPNAPVESVIGAQAARNNAATPGMTAGQFANKWTGKFGDIVQTVDPNQKNIIDAQADGPMAFAGQPAPMQPVAPQPAAGAASADMAAGTPAPIPAAVQPAAAPQNRFLFKNASDEDLQKALINPFTPENVRAALTQEYKLRADAAQKAADPMRNLQIQEAQTKLAPVGAPYKDADGNLVQKDVLGKVTVLSAADKAPNSVSEYKFYKDNFQPTPQQPEPMDYATFSTAKARAGATNISNNIDANSGQTYDKQLAEGLGKAHSALANGVEDAQTRARDIAAMQGAIDAIQKNGGTTGGLAPQQILDLQKSINAGAAAIGIAKPFSESDLSDKEFMTKFNRSMAGAQAKGAVGARVTNFEMSNFLKANPGLDMTIAGNQRLLGIQAQIEQRNIAVGNAIRDATAEAIGNGKKIDPRTVQKIIRDYDEANHITDPATGQDLTQSYVLPEFQSKGTNPAQAQRHEQNMSKVRRYNPATGRIE